MLAVASCNSVTGVWNRQRQGRSTTASTDSPDELSRWTTGRQLLVHERCLFSIFLVQVVILSPYRNLDTFIIRFTVKFNDLRLAKLKKITAVGFYCAKRYICLWHILSLCQSHYFEHNSKTFSLAVSSFSYFSINCCAELRKRSPLYGTTDTYTRASPFSNARKRYGNGNIQDKMWAELL